MISGVSLKFQCYDKIDWSAIWKLTFDMCRYFVDEAFETYIINPNHETDLFLCPLKTADNL